MSIYDGRIYMFTFNVYCDESCHLEKDGINVMVLGAVWCPKNKVREINKQIRDMKTNHGISPNAEIKWTKISPAKLELYKDLINYYFDNNELRFRALIVPDKSKLNHEYFNQDHDSWYYKMYFAMLKVFLNPPFYYEIYMDIKDTNSYSRAKKLHEVLCNKFSVVMNNPKIKRMQPIRSEEVQIMQLVDVLIGAVGYHNRIFPVDFKKSAAKEDIINLIIERSGCTLSETTGYSDNKCNLLVWDAQEV